MKLALKMKPRQVTRDVFHPISSSFSKLFPFCLMLSWFGSWAVQPMYLECKPIYNMSMRKSLLPVVFVCLKVSHIFNSVKHTCHLWLFLLIQIGLSLAGINWNLLSPVLLFVLFDFGSSFQCSLASACVHDSYLQLLCFITSFWTLFSQILFFLRNVKYTFLKRP